MRASLSKIGQSQVDTRGCSGWCGEPAGNYILRLHKTVFGRERLLLAPARRQTQDGAGWEVGNVEEAIPEGQRNCWMQIGLGERKLSRHPCGIRTAKQLGQMAKGDKRHDQRSGAGNLGGSPVDSGERIFLLLVGARTSGHVGAAHDVASIEIESGIASSITASGCPFRLGV